MMYKIYSYKDINWLEFDVLKNYKIKHFSTLSVGGFSKNLALPFNLGFVNSDNNENVLKNRLLLSEALEISLNQMIFANQTHSTNIYVARKEDRGKGALRESEEIDDVDAFIVEEKGICPVVQTADCVPIIVYSPILHIGAVVHSGWRGTSKKILSKTLDYFLAQNAKANEIIVCIGPSAGPCCYEVKEDVLEAFKKTYGKNTENIFEKNNNKIFLNLWRANYFQAKEKGITDSNIYISSLCTIHNSDSFFSARAHGNNAGRMLTGIMLL